jgi:nitroimidazol reductase NimA-like FMN-containing flavoprotein (pyridoxamine 5'-phosphate oxidase superfamily)
MRREEKRITETAAVEAILNRAAYCTIALCNGDRPYAVPMNFAYTWAPSTSIQPQKG